MSVLQVVKIIRAADDSADASSHLQQSFGMSKEQSEGVLNLSLRRLTSLEAQNLQAEHDDLVSRHASDALSTDSAALLRGRDLVVPALACLCCAGWRI